MADPNLDLLEHVIALLGPVANDVVLLGGCAAGLYLTDPAAAPPRPTRDVDVIAAITSEAQYHDIGARLRERGFREDTRDEALICRWRTDDIVLDVIPTDPKVLGFGNVWYDVAYREAVWFEMASGKTLRHVTAPCFLATKLVAFDDRGHGDFMMSHDIEDIIAVLDGRPEVVAEVAKSVAELRSFLAGRFSSMLATERFVEAVPGHLGPGEASQARAPIIMDRVRAIAAVG